MRYLETYNSSIFKDKYDYVKKMGVRKINTNSNNNPTVITEKFTDQFKTDDQVVKIFNSLLSILNQKDYNLFKEIQKSLSRNDDDRIPYYMDISDSPSVGTEYFNSFYVPFGNDHWYIDYSTFDDDGNLESKKTISSKKINISILRDIINYIMSDYRVVDLLNYGALKQINKSDEVINEMKYIELFENYIGIDIPIDIIVYVLQSYYTHKKIDVDIPNISDNIFEKSNQYLISHKVDCLYRGMSVEINEYEKMINDGYITSKEPQSWSFDIETSTAFSGGNSSDTHKRILIEYPLDKFHKLLSVDYIIENTTSDQIDELKKYEYAGWDCEGIYHFYLSESECISFDLIKIPMRYIKVI